MTSTEIISKRRTLVLLTFLLLGLAGVFFVYDSSYSPGRVVADDSSSCNFSVSKSQVGIGEEYELRVEATSSTGVGAIQISGPGLVDGLLDCQGEEDCVYSLNHSQTGAGSHVYSAQYFVLRGDPPVPPGTNVLKVRSQLGVNPIEGVSITRIFGTRKTGGVTNYDFPSSANISALLLAPRSHNGHVFNTWSGCSPQVSTLCTVQLSGGETVKITAHYQAPKEEEQKRLTGSISGSGVVNLNPPDIDYDSTDFEELYDHGTSVTLSYSPAEGYNFTGWSGDCSGTESCVLEMTADRSVGANFGEIGKEYELTVEKPGSGSGTVASSPDGIDCGSTCSANFDSGASVTLTATPAEGSQFTGWSGDCSGDGDCVVLMTDNSTVSASFTEIGNYTLTVNKDGGGSGTVTSSPDGIDCGGTCSADFTDGTSVELTASASDGSRFDGWSGSGCSGTGKCTVNMTRNRTVTATFVRDTYTLSGTIGGSGTVNVNPPNKNHSTNFQYTYDAGTAVTLTASASDGYVFSGWSGSCAGTGTCTVAMTANRSVTASFAEIGNYSLAVDKEGNGSGRVTSDPDGISCGSTCSTDFADGTSVELTAIASNSSKFDGWSGEGCSGTGTCTVIMTANRSVTATFNLKTYTVIYDGNGGECKPSSRTVEHNKTSDAPDCSRDGYSLDGFTRTSGSGGTLNTSTGEVTNVTGDQTIRANWKANQAVLHVHSSLDGEDNPGVNISRVGGTTGTGGETSYTFTSDSDIDTALRAPSSILDSSENRGRFSSWEGCDEIISVAGVEACRATLSKGETQEVTAHYKTRFTLTGTIDGSGEINVNPPDQDYTTNFQRAYDKGTEVTLTASASENYVFDGWSGDCSGDGNCVVEMTEDRSVTATFTTECLADGVDCEADADCCSGYCYRDEDGDGYHADTGQKYCQAVASKGLDCCDIDARVNPEQENFFTSRNNCNNFDYNCDGEEERHGDYCYQAKTCTGSGAQGTGCDRLYRTGVCIIDYDLEGSCLEGSCGERVLTNYERCTVDVLYEDCSTGGYSFWEGCIDKTDFEGGMLGRPTYGFTGWRDDGSYSTCSCR